MSSTLTKETSPSSLRTTSSRSPCIIPSPSGVSHYNLRHPAFFSDAQSHIIYLYLLWIIHQWSLMWLCTTSGSFKHSTTTLLACVCNQGWCGCVQPVVDSDAQPQPCLHMFAIKAVGAVSLMVGKWGTELASLKLLVTVGPLSGNGLGTCHAECNGPCFKFL